ncbi:MAG: hypothetical protein LC800_14485 [Acidobacteria bacterium]|nr:hypothetical protein [Acidobacteriota bacterium]
MDCKRCRVEIEEAGPGAGLRAAAGAHLAGCAGCRAFRAESESLRALVAGLGRVDAPHDFEFRLRARLAAEGAGRARVGWRTYFPRAAWAAAAGCLLLAVGVSLRPSRTATPAAAGVGSQPSSVAKADAGGNQTDPIRRPPNVVSAATPANASVEVAKAEGAAGGSRVANNRRADKPRRRQTVEPRVAVEEIAAGVGGAARFDEHSRSVIGGTVIPLQVSAEERPLQVTFKDMQGASRVVRVDPVAFGSREPNLSGARVVNATHKQGVW